MATYAIGMMRQDFERYRERLGKWLSAAGHKNDFIFGLTCMTMDGALDWREYVSSKFSIP